MANSQKLNLQLFSLVCIYFKWCLYIALLTETLKASHTASVELDRDYKNEYSDLQNPSTQDLVKTIKEQVRVTLNLRIRSLSFLFLASEVDIYKPSQWQN